MDKRTIIWAVSGAVLAAVVLGIGASSETVVSTPAAPKPASEAERLNELLPSFREKVVELLRRMRADGFRPMIKVAYRSPEVAQQKAEEGLGIANSMHTLGLAVDIIDVEKGWNAAQAFWDALHEHSLSLGLTRVQRTQADGTKVWDLAHVQAAPVDQQKALRTAKTAQARETILQKIYA